MLKIVKFFNISPKRLFSTSKDVFLSQCLKERTLLQITGDQVHAFLQGLMTNDMEHLNNGAPSIFCMFLNSTGRVKWDSIIYNTQFENTYYVECDSDAVDLLKNHLILFKVRRKVEITSMQTNMNVWVVANKNNFLNVTGAANYTEVLDIIRQEFPHLLVTVDPRLSSLGLRILSPKNFCLTKEIEKKLGVPVIEENFYQLLRYKLGVGEGLKELPYEKCFPMEANGDYLHGISFHKGCYLGQELTARTYHTGVIRKRLMPLSFNEEISISEGGIPIFTVPQSEKPIGKLRGVRELAGVGLLRINEALKADELMVLNTKCKTHRPFWWPNELPKERIKN